MRRGDTEAWTDRRSPSITDPGASFCPTATSKPRHAVVAHTNEDQAVRTTLKGGPKGRIYELNLDEHLSKQWGEPQ
jgi:hypothetical protein